MNIIVNHSIHHFSFQKWIIVIIFLEKNTGHQNPLAPLVDGPFLSHGKGMHVLFETWPVLAKFDLLIGGCICVFVFK